MVKKLFKHEIFAFLRVWIPVQIIMLSVASLNRIVQFFESDEVVYDIVFRSSIFAYVVAVIAAFGFTIVYSVVRYYKNLFSGEGYLTFTLPVTITQHIMVKLIVSVMFAIATIISVVLSFSILTSGELFVEIVKAVLYILKRILFNKEAIHICLYIAEIIIWGIASIASTTLLYYACITIGQLFNKNRILAAIGAFFAHYLISQILSTVLVIVFYFFANTGFMDAIYEFYVDHTKLSYHLLFCGFAVYNAVLSTVYFFISKIIIRKRLNIE